MELDWFGLDLADSPESRCIFCKDTQRKWFDENPSGKVHFHKTTSCGHRVCLDCEETYSKSYGTKITCPICHSKFDATQLKDIDPIYIALQNMNKIRKEVYDVFNLDESDFPSPVDYNKFLEEREDIIMNLLSHEKIMIENKDIKINSYREEYEKKKKEFEKKYKEKIILNKGRVQQHLANLTREIRQRNAEILEIKEQMNRERELEEERRLLEKQKNNDIRLGRSVAKAQDSTVITEKKNGNHGPSDVFYGFILTDNLSFKYGPPPTRVESASIPKMTDLKTQMRAGGLLITQIEQRTLAEIKGGWDLIQ